MSYIDELKNKIIINGSIAKIEIVSPKYGVFFAIIDKEDTDKICSHAWGIYYSKNNKSFYVVNRLSLKRTQLLHRVVTDCPIDLVVDHINHDTLDNRKENLRICTRKQNSENKKGALSNNRFCDIRGVSWDKSRNKWRATIVHNGKSIYLGRFDDIEEAKNAAMNGRLLFFDLVLTQSIIN